MTIKQLRERIIYVYGDIIRYLDANDINCIIREIVNKKDEYKRCRKQ